MNPLLIGAGDVIIAGHGRVLDSLHEVAFDLDLLGFAEEEFGRLLDGLDPGLGADTGGEVATYGVANGVTENGLNHIRNWNNAAPGGSPRPLDRGWTDKKDKPARLKGLARTCRSGSDARAKHEAGAPTNGVLMPSHTSGDPGFTAKKRAREAELGRELTTEEFLSRHYEASDAPAASGTSIFDPVLCEIA